MQTGATSWENTSAGVEVWTIDHPYTIFAGEVLTIVLLRVVTSNPPLVNEGRSKTCETQNIKLAPDFRPPAGEMELVVDVIFWQI